MFDWLVGQLIYLKLPLRLYGKLLLLAMVGEVVAPLVKMCLSSCYIDMSVILRKNYVHILLIYLVKINAYVVGADGIEFRANELA